MNRVLLILFLQLVSNNPTDAWGNCSKSEMCHQKLEDLRIEEIKQSILSSLHMSRPPSNGVVPSEELREEYRRMYERMNYEKENLHTEIVFVPAKDPSYGSDPSQLISTFEINRYLTSAEIQEATLVFQVDLNSLSEHEVHVKVFEKNTDGNIGDIIASQYFSVTGTQRLSISLPKEAVSKWYSGSTVSGIFVSAVVAGHNVAVHPQQTTKDYENMILQLTVTKNVRSRRHMAVPVCAKHEPTEGCCLYDLIVDFKKIGWNWVIAPTKYNAYMCRGDCQANTNQFGSIAHSKIMRGAYHLKDADAHLTSSKFCCHPTEYDDMQLVYVGNDKVVTTIRLDGMVARRCSCS